MRCHSVFGCAVVLLLVCADACGAPIRVADVVPGGTGGASQAIFSGDVVGTIVGLNEAGFNELSPAHLRGNYDVLVIGWAAPTTLNVDFATRIGPYLASGGGVIFESPQNISDLAPITGGTAFEATWADLNGHGAGPDRRNH